MKKSSAKKMTVDVIYNIFSSAIPTFLLQIVIHPFMNRVLGNADYGDMLTVISYVNICIGMFGAPLNNTRLLENDGYKSPGDFNILLAVSLSLSALIQSLFSAVYGFTFSLSGNLFLFGYNLAVVLVTYYSVEFRIHLSFKKIFLGKLCHAAGYVVGAIVFYFTKNWEIVFFSGGVFEFVFVLTKTKLWKEPYRKTDKFSSTAKRLFVLIGSNALISIVSYADRLIIYPFFGSADVSVYYSATVIGKGVLLATNPIGGVLLAYVAKMKEIRRKEFLFLLSAVSAVAFSGYFISNFLSEPLIKILYPNCYPYALALTPVTNATAMINLIYSFCWPVVFKFGGKTAPLIFTSVRMISYLTIAILGVHKLGIYSVCYGNLISTCLQSAMVAVIGFIASKKGIKSTSPVQ